MSRSTEVAIDMELMRRLEALPVRRGGMQALVPTPSQIEALRRFWKRRPHDKMPSQLDVAREIGVGVKTARDWFRKYVKEG